MNKSYNLKSYGIAIEYKAIATTSAPVMLHQTQETFIMHKHILA